MTKVPTYNISKGEQPKQVNDHDADDRAPAAPRGLPSMHEHADRIHPVRKKGGY